MSSMRRPSPYKTAQANLQLRLRALMLLGLRGGSRTMLGMSNHPNSPPRLLSPVQPKASSGSATSASQPTPAARLLTAAMRDLSLLTQPLQPDKTAAAVDYSCSDSPRSRTGSTGSGARSQRVRHRPFFTTLAQSADRHAGPGYDRNPAVICQTTATSATVHPRAAWPDAAAAAHRHDRSLLPSQSNLVRSECLRCSPR